MDPNESRATQIDRICDQFDEAHRQGRQPEIVVFLERLDGEAPNTELRLRLLIELILIDLEYRLRGKEAVRIEDYGHRFPELVDDDGFLPHRLFDAEASLVTTMETDIDEEDPYSTIPTDSQGQDSKQLKPEGKIATGTDADLPPDSDTYPTVDDYKIVHEIARGGMGVVYKAWDKNLKCHVALKTIRSGAFAGREEIERFHLEAESAAGLQHPGIVRVHRFGQCDGLDYFTMDFVDGSSLADVVRANALDIQSAVRYTIEICEAIEFAHQHGILHRDLKPANVLIEKQSRRALVSDFGLAKRMEEESDFSRSGQAIGTPAYMPPEQAAGRKADIGYQSDVYSIGALLYHLLTGQPPFVGESHHEIMSQVLDQDPSAVSKLNPRVKRDLNTICLKCLEKDRVNRYVSAAELRDELRRFSQGFPIRARPVSVIEQGWRWCRRNSMAASLLLVVFLVMAVGGGLGVFQRGRFRESIDERLRAAEERLDAEISSAEVIDESAHDALIPGRVRLDADKLKAALREYEKVLGDWRSYARNDVTVGARQQGIADALFRVAQSTRMLGEIERSESSFQLAIQRYEELISKNSNNPHFAVMQGKSLDYLAELYREYGTRNNVDDLAEDAYRRSLAVLERCVANFPAHDEARMELARTENNYGILLQQSCRPGQALNRYARSESTLRKLVDQNPDNQDYCRDFARTLINVGALQRSLGRSDIAQSSYDEAIKEFEHLLSLYPKSIRYKFLLATTKMNLGFLLTRKGVNSLDQAEDVLKQSLDKLRTLPESIPEYRISVAKCLINLALVDGTRYYVTNEQDHLESATKHCTEAEGHLVSLIEQHPHVAEIESWMGQLQGSFAAIADGQKQYKQFEKRVSQAIAHQREAVRSQRHTCRYEELLQNHHVFLALQILDHYVDEQVEQRKLIAVDNLLAAIKLGYRADFDDSRFDAIRDDLNFKTAIESLSR